MSLVREVSGAILGASQRPTSEASLTEPSTPAASPKAPTAASPEPRSPWFARVRAALWFTGAMYVVLGGVATAVFVANAVSENVFPPAYIYGFGFAAFVLSVGFGALNFVAARGLDKETRWGWILSLVIAGLYAPSACLPIGGFMLVGLLNDDVRKRCMD